MKIEASAASVCGLFCGTCPSFLDGECEGCLSKKNSCYCNNHFKNCADEKRITRCYECHYFPCQKLEEFKESHFVNGISHHHNIILNLKRMKEVGVEAFIEEEKEANTCPVCGKMIVWYEKKCGCKKN